MTEDLLENIAYISALEVPADAVLAVKCRRRITADQAERILEQLGAALPGRPVLVLPPELDLVVVRDAGAS